MGYKITIDGPSASGKGFIAREISTKLGILNVDTGAMYRAFGMFCIENNVNLNSDEEVREALKKADIDFDYEGNELRIILNGEDVSSAIRTEQIGMLASIVSAIPAVRQDMVERQRKIAELNNIIMEGRDIGSVVFPEAELKIFLTAAQNTRAERRYKDLVAKNKEITFEQVLKDIKRRDESDVNKSISPLIKTEDMIQIDTTFLDKQQVVSKVLELIKEKGLIDFDKNTESNS